MVQDSKTIIKKNFLYRSLTLFFLLPITFFCIYSNGFWSKSLILLCSVMLANEWFYITQKDKKEKNLFFFIFFVFLNIFSSIYIDFFFSILLTIILSLFLLKDFFFNLKINLKDDIWLFRGFIFISLPLIIFLRIEKIENGSLLLLWLFISICTTDVFSYLFGNLIKGPKIFPSISPHKTFSGTILGIFIGTLCGTLFFIEYLNFNNLFLTIFYSFILCFFGLIGDLIISTIKRHFNIKDSGKILPGHGGLLDRYDSISFSLMILFFLVYFF